MDYFQYKNGELYAEDISVQELAQDFGTPCYVYSRATIERHWQNTFKLGMGAIWKGEKQNVGFGASYDSSPVTDRNRTMDLPLDKQVGVGFSYIRDRDKKFNWALSANITWFGDGKVDQTIQGARIVGEFDTNYALFLAGTMTYRFGRS